jgi:hypothetical protein
LSPDTQRYRNEPEENMPSLTGDDGTSSGFSPFAPFGVWGDSGSAGPFGGGGNGVIGSSALSSGIAGFTLANSDRAAGVFGAGPLVGIAGGVTGSNTAPGGRVGVYGTGSNRQNLGGVGVVGESDTAAGVAGESTSGSGVSGLSESGPGVVGVSGEDVGVIGISNGVGILGLGGDGGGFFFGNVQVTGSLIKAGGGFAIDHPLNPANQYLRHSFVESPEMKNLYDGVAVCDVNGEAVVQVPDWFEALNENFRYQLTPIGSPAPGLFIATEIQEHRFRIAGGSPGQKVSWQVTGVRCDAWAQANPILVEEGKSADDLGRFLHPGVHGHPPDRTIAHAHYIRAQRHRTRT